jgi:hypothetical protein
MKAIEWRDIKGGGVGSKYSHATLSFDRYSSEVEFQCGVSRNVKEVVAATRPHCRRCLAYIHHSGAKKTKEVLVVSSSGYGASEWVMVKDRAAGDRQAKKQKDAGYKVRKRICIVPVELTGKALVDYIERQYHDSLFNGMGPR